MRLHFIYILFFSMVPFSVGATKAPETDLVLKRFPVIDRTFIHFLVPKNWAGNELQFHENIKYQLPDVQFLSTDGDLNVTISLIFPDNKVFNSQSPDVLKRDIEQRAQQLSSSPTITVDQINVLKSMNGTGYYLSATSDEEILNDNRHWAFGIFPVGEFTLIFTVLSRVGQEDRVQNALNVISKAVLVDETP